MEAAGNGHGDHLVSVWSDDGGELPDSLGVAAGGESNKQFATDAKDVTTFDRSGKRNVVQLAKRLEGGSEAGGFGAARCGAEREDYGEFVENESRIFNEHGIRKIGFGRERDNARAEIAEKFFVGVMLRLRFCQIDGLAGNESELTLGERWTDSARDGSEHGRRM